MDRDSDRIDEELDALLAALPRERAGRGFGQAVQARIHRPPGRRSWLPLAAGAAAAVLVVVLVLVVRGQLARERAGRAELVEHIAELRRDHDRLSAELRQLRARLRREQPVLYLGGDDRVDYVLDLRRLVGTGTARGGRAKSRGESL
jgi:hypothetical protein